MRMLKPSAPLAITMGDPAGIGPEVIVRSWLHPSLQTTTRRVVIGVPDVIERAIRLCRLPLQVRCLHTAEEAYAAHDAIGVLPLELPWPGEFWRSTDGQVRAECGEAAYQALRRATDLALGGEAAGIVTPPLHKEALQKAGHSFPGHTEMLAAWTGATQHAMMLYLPPHSTWSDASPSGAKPGDSPSGLGGKATYPAGPVGLGVVHTTLHLRLRDIFAALTVDAVLEKCGLAVQFVRAMLAASGLARSEQVAVAALNPHAGEHGLFGDEEQRIIAPAVAAGRARGWELSGPHPTDTLMVRAVQGEFDAVVAMYHDQGHIALKLIGFERAVNVTLGLPIVRTSVAHGTAFDIAWRGLASGESMVAATLTAARLCANAE